MSKPAEITFEPTPDYGDLMPLEKYLEHVRLRLFIDYDGFADLATETTCSNWSISPSNSLGYNFPEWATHVVWYNK